MSLKAPPVFSIVVLTTLGLFGLIGVMLFGGQLGLEAIAAMGHFGAIEHRIHDLTYTFLFSVAAIGTAAQFRNPTQNVAGQLMALIPWIAFTAAFALGDALIVLFRPAFVPVFGALAVLAAALHPRQGDLFRSLSLRRASRMMIALVAMAAAPLLTLAFTNIDAQRTVPDDHAAMGHYGYMAAFSFTVIATGLLAGLRPDGWRLSAWVAGLLPAFLGLASLLVPDAASRLDPAWALAAIAWSIAFLTAARLTEDSGAPMLFSPPRDTPRWLNVFVALALIPILLVVLNLIAGVLGLDVGGGHGPGLHTPPVQHGLPGP